MDAVLFDMDGVLVDSVSYKYEHWKRVLWDDIGLTAVDVDALVGLNSHDKYEYLVDQHGLQTDRDRFLRLLNGDVDRMYEEQVQLLEGVESSFEWLAGESIPVGLVSASSRDNVKTVVDRFEIGDSLDTVVSADDIDDDSKPDPAIYRHAAATLDAELGDCLAIEDSPHGVTAATGAGAYCIGYAPSDRPDRDIDHADEVVTSPERLQERIRTIVVGQTGGVP